MKNVTILLAVLAVVAMAVPAWGGVGAFFTWKGSATDTNWETPGNWVISPYLTAPHLGNTYDFYADAGYTILATKPLATVYARYVSGPGTTEDITTSTTWANVMDTFSTGQYGPVLISAASGASFCWKYQIGAGSTSAEIEMGTGTYTVALSSSNGWGLNYNTTNYGLLTQKGGTLTGGLGIGSAWGNDAYPGVTCDGRYVIEGGTLNAGSVTLGGQSSRKTGKGSFTVVGTGPTTINVTSSTAAWTQTPRSTLKVILDSAGNVTKINLTNVGGMAKLSGYLEVDASAYTGANKIIDILTAAGGVTKLKYTGFTTDLWYFSATDPGVAWPDLALLPIADRVGSTITDDGAGTLQVNLIPEPATLALLGLGGIGVLLRRRRA